MKKDEWIRQAFCEVSSDIYAVYLFGSELIVDSTPSDTDLFVITKGNAGSSPWLRARRFCEQVRESFTREFGIPLSIILTTQSEWAEFGRNFVTEKRRLL
jgi:hypothetical protein